jgi:hypothetical protein
MELAPKLNKVLNAINFPCPFGMESQTTVFKLELTINRRNGIENRDFR